MAEYRDYGIKHGKETAMARWSAEVAEASAVFRTDPKSCSSRVILLGGKGSLAPKLQQAWTAAVDASGDGQLKVTFQDFISQGGSFWADYLLLKSGPVGDPPTPLPQGLVKILGGGAEYPIPNSLLTFWLQDDLYPDPANPGQSKACREPPFEFVVEVWHKF